MSYRRIASIVALSVAFTIALLCLGFGSTVARGAGGGLLTGTVKSASGEKMAGVSVSAKADGQTMTTTVFTDDQGAYYFPVMEAGKYRVWAQTYSFETGRGEVELTGTRRQDFVLKPMKDFEQQLTGDQILAALPDAPPGGSPVEAPVQKRLHELPSAELYPSKPVR